jgi:protein O-mannosyl-transferase
VWDDHAQIVENPLLRSWHNVPRAFTSQLWFMHNAAVHQAYYRPVPVVSGIAVFALFGVKAWGWHLFAIVLHMIASCAVFALARRLRFEYWTAALAALIFAIHPVHVESVAWAGAGSLEPLLAIFLVLGFVAFLAGRASGGFGWKAASYALLAAALFSKETAVTFCALVFIYEWLDGRGQAWTGRLVRAAVAALPYTVITAAYLIIRQLVLQRFASFMQPPSAWMVLLTEPVVLLRYVRMLLFPMGLNALYYTPYVTQLGFATLASALALLAITALLWRWYRRSGDRNVAFAALWTLLTLAPVLYLPAFTPGDFVRDRYMYLPSIGFALLAAKAIRQLPSFGRLTAPVFQGAVCIVLALLLAVGTVLQQSYWANDIVLFYRGYSLNPHSIYAATSLGQALERHGYYERAAGILEDVVRRQPAAGPAYYVLASAYVHLGRNDDARKALAQATTVFPAYAEDQAGMNDVAAIYGGLGEYERALQIYSEVLRKQPDYYLALYNSGYTCFRLGRLDDAERFFRHAVQVAPDLSPPNFFLGRVLLIGQRPEAEAYLRRAVRITPDGHEYHFWLGQALEMRGDLTAARQEYLRELQIDPSDRNARLRLAALGN